MFSTFIRSMFMSFHPLSVAHGLTHNRCLIKVDSFELRRDAVCFLLWERAYCQNNYKSWSFCPYQLIDFLDWECNLNRKHHLPNGSTTKGLKDQLRFHQVSFILPDRILPHLSALGSSNGKRLLAKTKRKPSEERVIFLLIFKRKERILHNK